MKLDWKRTGRAATVPHAARKTAVGRYPGWSYELLKTAPFEDAAPIWFAYFHDDSLLGRRSRRECPSTQRLGSGSYAQALTAVLNHHNYSG